MRKNKMESFKAYQHFCMITRLNHKEWNLEYFVNYQFLSVLPRKSLETFQSAKKVGQIFLLRGMTNVEPYISPKAA